MAKKKSKVLPVIFVILISVLLGVATTLVIEDLLGVPYTAPPTTSLDPTMLANLLLNNFTFDAIKNILTEHPDWAESIAKFILEHFDMSKLTQEQLQQLCQMFPGMEKYLGALLLSQLLDAGQRDLVPEPKTSAGLPSPTVDNGSFDPDKDYPTVFTVESTYKGWTYIRSTSFGDYDPASASFLNAPEFDGSTYIATPALYASYAASTRRNEMLTFHLRGHRDYGTLAGSDAGPYYTYLGNSKNFSPESESRLWLVDMDDYSVPFYPNLDYSTLPPLPSLVSEDEMRYRRYVKKNYLDVPEELKGYLDSFLRTNALQSPQEVSRFLKSNYVYEPKSMDCPKGQDRIIYFLNTKKAGICSNFASAMTLLCRALKVPARYVVGYYSNLDTRGENEITYGDAHAWVEVYQNGVGWERIDPTPAVVLPEEDPTEPLGGDIKNDFPRDTSLLFSYESSGTGPLYFRSRSYGDYDSSARRFLPMEKEPEEPSLNYLPSLLNSDGAKMVTLRYADGFAPQGMLAANYNCLGYSTETGNDPYDFMATDYFEAVGDTRYRRSARTYSHLFHDDPAGHYYGRVSDDAYYRYAQGAYSAVPKSMEGTLDQYLERIEATTPNQLRDALSSYHYFNPDLVSSDPIDELLTRKHEGNAKSFAAAMTLLCRRLGYLARYVEGYYVPGLSRQGTVSHKESRAWVEVYSKGIGWFRYDPMGKQRVAHPEEMVLSTKNTNFVYDGLPHSATQDLSIAYPSTFENYLNYGDALEFQFSKSSQNQVRPGRFRISARVKVLSYWGDDVSEDYSGLRIDNAGTLTIERRPITLKTNDQTVTPMMALNRYVEPIMNLADGDVFDADAVQFTYIDVNKDGVYENSVDPASIHIYNASHEEVTDCYEITFEFGTIIIGEEQE